MKRKFLEDIGLSKEQVDNIMAENGKDIEAIKSERDNYKTQLDTAQTTLKSFEGVNVQDLQGKVTKLKASKNQEADIKTALEAVKKDNAYLFQDIQIPKVVSYTPGSGGKGTEDTKTRANEALRSIFGRE